MLDAVPDDIVSWMRRWDLAATEPNENNKDPDWTAGVLMGKRKSGRFVVVDANIFRKRSDDVRTAILRTAENDGHRVKIGIPQDPGHTAPSSAAGAIGISVVAGTASRSTRDPTTDPLEANEPSPTRRLTIPGAPPRRR